MGPSPAAAADLRQADDLLSADPLLLDVQASPDFTSSEFDVCHTRCFSSNFALTHDKSQWVSLTRRYAVSPAPTGLSCSLAYTSSAHGLFGYLSRFLIPPSALVLGDNHVLRSDSPTRFAAPAPRHCCPCSGLCGSRPAALRRVEFDAARRAISTRRDTTGVPKSRYCRSRLYLLMKQALRHGGRLSSGALALG